MRIAQHRIDSNYFVLVRCHFRISSQANTNVLKCSKHSYWPCESKPIHIASYCIAERRINACQFLLVRISSLYIRIDSLCICIGIRRLSAATQYVAIRCATIALSYWIAHVRIGSCKFLLVPIVFSSHHSAIVLILHHHCIATYCIVSPSWCILLHLTASYQFVFNYTPRTTKLLGGILVSLRPSVRPSVCPSVRPSRLPCPLCNIYSSGWILSIWATNDHYHERVCRTQWPVTLTYIFKVIRPWLWKLCPLCGVYSSGWILFYVWHKWSLSLEGVSRVRFFSESENLHFWQIFEILWPWPWKKNLQFSMDSFHI